METRSLIAVSNEHGSIDAIYCQWDGYLNHNGKILIQHYNNSDKARALIALGDLSSLGNEIGRQHEVDWGYNNIANHNDNVSWCTSYTRDRSNSGSLLLHTAIHQMVGWTVSNRRELVNILDVEYYYLMENGAWYVSTGSEFMLLHDAIEIENEEEMV